MKTYFCPCCECELDLPSKVPELVNNTIRDCPECKTMYFLDEQDDWPGQTHGKPAPVPAPEVSE